MKSLDAQLELTGSQVTWIWHQARTHNVTYSRHVFDLAEWPINLRSSEVMHGAVIVRSETGKV